MLRVCEDHLRVFGLGKVTLAALNNSLKNSVALAPAMAKDAFMESGKNRVVGL